MTSAAVVVQPPAAVTARIPLTTGQGRRFIAADGLASLALGPAHEIQPPQARAMPDVIVSRPMASRTTHPLPILPGGPWCPTQDEAIELFVQYQGAGHIRRCAYALVEGVAHQEW